MTSRLKKCLDPEIVILLDSHSESDQSKAAHENVKNSPKGKSSHMLQRMKDILDETTDTEDMFKRSKYLLSRKNELQKESVSLRIKLRRSTEQSMYKIDSDSEYKSPIRKCRSTVSRQTRKSCSDMESDASCSDTKSGSDKNKIRSARKFSEVQDENRTPQRSSRVRKQPLRLSYYHCETLSKPKSQIGSPSLRKRKNINYNEEELYLLSVSIEKKVHEPAENPDSNAGSGAAANNSEIETSDSATTKKKRNRTSSMKSRENNSDACSTVSKGQLSMKTNVIENRTNSEEQKKSILQTGISDEDDSLRSVSPTVLSATPKTRRQTKSNVRSRKTMSKLNVDDEDTNDEEYIFDAKKRIKSSPTKRSILTPLKEANVEKTRKALQTQEDQPSTPKLRTIKCSNLTPSMEKRFSALLKPGTPLQKARSRLHVSAVPKSLPCREEEFNNIFTFLKGKLMDNSGGCIYISGVPGTGKTATVNEVVKCLQKLTSKGELDSFDYVAINGMKLTEPRQSYVQILKQLTGQTGTWEQAYRALEKRFGNSNSKMTLLLIDELDFLCTKRQDVVYNLLDWPTKASAQLVVVTIANTMDLPERVLMGRVTSRLGLTRLTFQPYNHKQLQEIISTRLKDFDGFRSEAVQLIARKVSAVSGDARRALDICRRAMEIAESRDVESITLQDVTQAISEMIASAKIQAIKHCSKMEQIFLQAVSAEVTRTAIEEVYFKDAYRQLEALCSFDGIKIPTVTEVLAICGRLGAYRLLICEHSRNDIHQKILLNVSTDDIHYAIQELDLNAT